MAESQSVYTALRQDGDELRALLAGIDADRWAAATPAPGWTVAHQVAHMAVVFQIAGMAAAAPERFRQVAEQAKSGFEAAVTAALQPYLALPPGELLDRWWTELGKSTDALAAAPVDQVVPWLVNPLPPHVLAGAGMTELFAHGQDIRDALGVGYEATDRLRHVVDFVVHTRDFGYLGRGLTPPAAPFRFEITSPSGGSWTFGPPDATQRITGTALDLCLLATRRRHHEDVAVVATGADAEHWLTIAQAYRGPAGEGRRPGQFATTG